MNKNDKTYNSDKIGNANANQKGVIDMVTSNSDAIEWLLARQAELRSELLTFYKKDLKEIHAALSGLSFSEQDENTFGKDVVKEAERIFIERWGQSFDMISAER